VSRGGRLVCGVAEKGAPPLLKPEPRHGVEMTGTRMSGPVRQWDDAGAGVGKIVALSGENKIFAGTDCLP
jgi:hypothetical protein